MSNKNLIHYDETEAFDYFYEMIQNADSEEYKQYMDIVRTYNLHPDDDFEKIINIMIDEIDSRFEIK